jgi:16S rRNA C967 or C1407 C5-methylase (RsmB/RsmF family)
MAYATAVAHPLASDEGGHSTFSSIVAHDVVEERLRQIEGSMMRAGFVINANGNDGMKGGHRSYISQKRHGDYNCTIEISTSTDLTVEYSSPTLRFDAVLVDAPCSSTGVLRRRPSQRWDLTEAQMYDALPKLQLEILEKAASFVGTAGGRLVYSTCSILREENEGVAKMFESSDIYREGGFERWDFVPVVTSDGHSYAENDTMNDDGGGAFFKEGCSNAINLLPSKSGSDGFFIARWKRRKN